MSSGSWKATAANVEQLNIVANPAHVAGAPIKPK